MPLERCEACCARWTKLCAPHSRWYRPDGSVGQSTQLSINQRTAFLGRQLDERSIAEKRKSALLRPHTSPLTALDETGERRALAQQRARLSPHRWQTLPGASRGSTAMVESRKEEQRWREGAGAGEAAALPDAGRGRSTEPRARQTLHLSALRRQPARHAAATPARSDSA
ncbi:hypothetical protein FA09DRAFT_254270 [Tilletiopsis washingtonensis]|uniref:Uncharacterized protein n=1 Tax=Tilletiopsis washingtonensis TaxID=58919 RepID=A0A316ZBB2_9BASI|nr:hypothetical protein FA09DRAFT_254270 [Tilletiopsis washingtonensis]PWN98829.1 hypothetical protein FA09DRAFT_254270 [Tilletiopsis washingtonensis]